MFATYAELQQDIADWLHRPDLSVQIPAFIRLGEGWLNRKLRVSQMVTFEQKTLYANAYTVAKPARCADVLSVSVNNSRLFLGSGLTPLSDERGAPSQWEPVGNAIWFDRYADTTYSPDICFLMTLDLAADSINWLLRLAPEAYLYAALMHSSQYLLDDQRLANVVGQANAIVNELNATYPVPNTDLLYSEVA